jgi:hypothetical protein
MRKGGQSSQGLKPVCVHASYAALKGPPFHGGSSVAVVQAVVLGGRRSRFFGTQRAGLMRIVFCRSENRAALQWARLYD